MDDYSIEADSFPDPLQDIDRDTGFNDPFWDFPRETIEDLANEVIPFLPPSNY